MTVEDGDTEDQPPERSIAALPALSAARTWSMNSPRRSGAHLRGEAVAESCSPMRFDLSVTSSPLNTAAVSDPNPYRPPTARTAPGPPIFSMPRRH